MAEASATPQLRRVLSLPWLVFYGVGVTVGAGIFALIGEIIGIAGDHAPWSFAVAGVVAGFTALSFAALSAAYPRAAGEVIYVKEGIGPLAGRLVGYALLLTALMAASVISLAFARYVASFSGVPEWAALAGVLVALCAIAIAGVKESVAAAALITALEVGTLLIVIAAGLPAAVSSGALWTVLAPPQEGAQWSAVLAGSFLAFFAFIGFENIVNMAEETEDAARVIPRAVILTLVISVTIYALAAAVAAAYADRAALVESKAPLAVLFEGTTGQPAAVIAAMASIAMVNGILVQIVMASRVLYGMAGEGMMPPLLGRLHPRRQTPIAAILLFTALIGLLALTVPLISLAEMTSFVILVIFTLVNASLFLIGRRPEAPPGLRRWRWAGLLGALVTLGLILSELAS
ncbi:MAG: amino acid permease [Aestuariivirga sp.]|nr:amino acid permease [Aestuariivirga sp.]